MTGPGWADRPRGPLGDLETRIRLALEQEGRIPLELLTGVDVSLQGPSLDLPGFSKTRGRRFQATHTTTAAGRFAIICPTVATIQSNGIILTGLLLNVRVALSEVWWRAMDPATTAAIWPGLLTTVNVFSVDARGVSTGGEIPAATGVAAPGGVARPADANGRMTFPNNQTPLYFPMEVFLPPGNGFELAAVALTTELDVTFFGRVF